MLASNPLCFSEPIKAMVEYDSEEAEDRISTMPNQLNICIGMLAIEYGISSQKNVNLI